MPPPSPVALVGADDLVARLAGAIEAVAVDRDLLRGLDPGAEHADSEVERDEDVSEAAEGSTATRSSTKKRKKKRPRTKPPAQGV